MKENKNTCPICFTKMQAVDHSLVCPECGYRYCDHSYDNRDIYSTNHTHTPNYTTTQAPAQKYTGTTGQNVPRTPAPGQSNVPSDMRKAGKIIKTILIIYFLIVLISSVLPILFELFFQ